jgi:hypothetical protein
MNVTDLAVAFGAAVIGFGVIWGVFGLIRQQKAAPLEMFKVEPKSPADSRVRINLAELGQTWHVILGVDAGATAQDIEAGYHARLADCDRIRFSSTASPLEKQEAEVRRAQVNEAYEFIRSIRH